MDFASSLFRKPATEQKRIPRIIHTILTFLTTLILHPFDAFFLLKLLIYTFIFRRKNTKSYSRLLPALETILPGN